MSSALRSSLSASRSSIDFAVAIWFWSKSASASPSPVSCCTSCVGVADAFGSGVTLGSSQLVTFDRSSIQLLVSAPRDLYELSRDVKSLSATATETAFRSASRFGFQRFSIRVQLSFGVGVCGPKLVHAQTPAKRITNAMKSGT